MHEYGFQFTSEHDISIKLLRVLYNQEEYMRLKPIRGKRAEKQSDMRKRAICLVNLITANRPSEMVRLKVSDFDLENRTIQVIMVKQGKMKEKRLTLECVQAIRNYIVACELMPEDYFVGVAEKWGNHTSRQISEISYNRAIQSWLDFAPYTFRKTQITAMYQKCADIPTIAKQSGHKSHQTIMEHYIKLKSDDVDEFL